MKGFVYHGHKNVVFSTSVDEPKIEVPWQVIVDVHYCGICATDLHEYLDGPIFFPKDGEANPLSNRKTPQCMGHEFSGIISEVGADVKDLKVGDHVVVEASVSCRDRKAVPNNNPNIDTPMCECCKKGLTNICKYGGFMGLGFGNGALAERVLVQQNHVLKVPDDLPLDIAALIEPLSVAWHAVRLSGFKEGSSALILGAGPIGLATVLALQGHKAGRIVVSEPAKIRREQAAKLGVHDSFNPVESSDAIKELREMSSDVGDGFEYAFDCSGVQVTMTTAINALAAHGTAVNVAIWPDKPVDFKPMDLTLLERFYCGSIGYTRQDFAEVIAAIRAGHIDVNRIKTLITGVIPLKDTLEKGFDALINRKDANIKILVTPKDI